MTTVRGLVAELNSAGDLPAGFGPLLETVPRGHADTAKCALISIIASCWAG